jgi:uncharacterized protein (DUF1330 family)
MKVVNELLPSTPEQIQAMQEPGPTGPIYMVNLLKFREKAEYEDGRESDLSGRAAYQLYGLGVMQLLPEYGGKLVFVGNVTGLQIGKVEELWDEVVIAMYPDRAALLAMSTSKEWRDLSVHRAAGLAGQLNIETVAPAAAPARR